MRNGAGPAATGADVSKDETPKSPTEEVEQDDFTDPSAALEAAAAKAAASAQAALEAATEAANDAQAAAKTVKGKDRKEALALAKDSLRQLQELQQTRWAVCGLMK